MSLVTAIKSYLTPTKYYRNANVTVTKKLLPNGSTRVESYDRDAKLLKSVVIEPIDKFTYSRIKGNTLKYGHTTTVKDYVSGTDTVIQKYSYRFEKPVYDALNPKEVMADAGGSIDYLHKFTTKNGKYVESFNWRADKRSNAGVKIIYDDMGNPVSATKLKAKKGQS